MAISKVFVSHDTNPYQVIDPDTLFQSISIDSRKLSSNPLKYLSKNYLLYTLAENLWLLQCVDAAEVGDLWIRSMKHELRTKGLATVIDEAVALSEQLIANNVIGPNSVWYPVISRVNMRDGLQLLRFLKRFSPEETDLLSRKTLDDFLEIERDLKMAEMESFTLNSLRNVILTEARIVCADLLSTYTASSSGYFSDGAVADTSKDKASKFLAARKKDISFNILPFWQPDHLNYSKYDYTATYLDVNKSYKKRRSIAKEEAGRQYHMQAMRRDLERSTSHIFAFDDQSRNAIAAKQASITKNFATIDLSAASDRLSVIVASQILPTHIFNECMRLRSKYVRINGNRRLLHKMFTSGSALCFPIETICFYCIAQAAIRLQDSLSGDVSDNSHVVLQYGDDMVVSSYYAETVMQALSACNLVVNVEKTHWENDDPYRESCGSEYFDGVDISTKYFPRQSVSFDHSWLTPMGYATVIDLQHRLFERDFCYSNLYLVSFIKDHVAVPVTESCEGSPYMDVWSTSPHISYYEYDGDVVDATYNNVKSPRGFNMCRDYQRTVELHTMLTQKFPKLPNVPPLQVEAGAVLQYVDFLQHGPRIVPIEEDPMGHFMGVHQHADYRSLYAEPELRLTVLAY